MKFGLYLSNYGQGLGARQLSELAAIAEESGWDGFFLWDHIVVNRSNPVEMVDTWVALTPMAMATQRIYLGTTITPLPRRRPWKLARETVTLDHLSCGRVILGVGLGEPGEIEFGTFGEDSSLKTRAEKLDEGLQILNGLWQGLPFKFNGKHYKIKKTTFLPAALQQPRIPIWVGGFWPHKAPFRRATSWDGVIPLKENSFLRVEDVCSILDFIRPLRMENTPFDFVVIGSSGVLRNGVKGAKKVAAYAEAGATWWLENLYPKRDSYTKLQAHIRKGPEDI
ncbi:MAG: LLM class flavin-dependent oxidoreductase [Anaerolineales bacterium]|nr:LLM class flavin-dependent oxidoreductase [Anaerolineales bacterium]